MATFVTLKLNNMKKQTILLFGAMAFTTLLMSCGGGKEEAATGEAPESMVEETKEYDASRGEGDFDETNVKLGALDAKMASAGEAISNTKCISCHKLTDEKLVGPGWKGVTERRKAHWIMNFITNPDPMIEKDPEIQAQLELCLVRMPNQSLSGDDARSIVEFMRKNDGVK